jgi:hypothetical protein
MEHILQLLDNLDTKTILYEKFRKFITEVGVFLNEEQTESDIVRLYMESIGLELVVQKAKVVTNKRDMLAHIVVSFTDNNPMARYRILEKLAQAFKSDLKNLSSILAHMSSYIKEEEMSDLIFDFYWYKSMKILNYSYPSMKANGLKILNEISRFNMSKIFLSLQSLQRLADESWWEIKAQILIICSNQLEYIESQEEAQETQVEATEGNTSEVNATDANATGEVEGTVNGTGEEEQVDQISEDRESQAAGENGSEFELSNKEGSRVMYNSTIEKTSETKEIEMKEFLKAKDGYVKSLLEIIYKIFHVHQNVNVQKVGLIYLARILNYFPELCERYLEVLLKISDEVKMCILNTDPEYNREFHIVRSKPPLTRSLQLLQILPNWRILDLELLGPRRGPKQARQARKPGPVRLQAHRDSGRLFGARHPH